MIRRTKTGLSLTHRRLTYIFTTAPDFTRVRSFLHMAAISMDTVKHQADAVQFTFSLTATVTSCLDYSKPICICLGYQRPVTFLFLAPTRTGETSSRDCCMGDKFR